MIAKTKYNYIYLLGMIVFLLGCKKLISIDEPADKVTAEKLFATDEGARSAMAGVYSAMINGADGTNFMGGLFSLFAGGESTYLGALSADEMVLGFSVSPYNTNHIVVGEGTTALSDALWASAYAAVNGCNAVIDGIAASTSAQLRQETRIRLTAEARFVRAFSYFYLVNFFGDVPLALLSDPFQMRNLKRSPVTEVYDQIIKDLVAAQTDLPADYSISKDRRIRATKWAATALLARVYLYTGNYPGAIEQATALINNTSLFGLENLNSVFLTGSRESIWQLQQNIRNSRGGNSTDEGYFFLPNPLNEGPIGVYMSNSLLNAFESGDQRRNSWVGVTRFMLFPPDETVAYYPYKYKTGSHNLEVGAEASEYYTVLRLAEQYLIRAEARANGAGGYNEAIDDLNELRNRAGLDDLPYSITPDQLKAAIAQEWRIEYFCEWGHRWFNLKRTKTARSVLSVIPYKQPWAGDHQLLYPIPPNDTLYNAAIHQNPGY